MNPARAEDTIAPPHPRETMTLCGHCEAEQALLGAYRSTRMPHAWLIGGPPGIGKATLAYRMARFVLAHPDPGAPAVRAAQSLAVAPEHPVARRVAALAHGDLLALERTEGESGALRTVITVDQVRRTVAFFGSTAGEGGWRVCVVDSADELKYPEASNALLKMLEEPPRRALFLIVSHAPGRLLATIRSRCRRLMLRPLAVEDVIEAAAAALAVEADADLRRAAALADGSVARAIKLCDPTSFALRERLAGLLDRLPHSDPRELHALGDSLSRAHEGAFETFLDAVRDWLTGRLAHERDGQRLARIGETWEAFNRAAGEVQVLNLDRKPFVFSAFGLLAEAARG
ncbi:MAG TPA: DNA polymerase III subunit delta' [Xanthobacteraceae bacterium]